MHTKRERGQNKMPSGLSNRFLSNLSNVIYLDSTIFLLQSCCAGGIVSLSAWTKRASPLLWTVRRRWPGRCGEATGLSSTLRALLSLVQESWMRRSLRWDEHVDARSSCIYDHNAVIFGTSVFGCLMLVLLWLIRHVVLLWTVISVNVIKKTLFH